MNDTNTYEQINFNPTSHISYDANTLIDFLHTRHHIDYDTKCFLQPKNPARTPIFYGLPKIHKPNTPLRPIVSGFDSPTDNLARYITHFLQPLAELLPSHIKDSRHFMQLIYDIPPLPQNTFLVTADVSSLYTNIPHDEGIEAAAFYIDKHRDTLPSYAPNTHVFKIILEFILKHSSFQFLDKHFKQLYGTSMGGRYAPPYANLFMGIIETLILQNETLVHFWKRFIDDIFFIFIGSRDELHTFTHKMNSIHPTIKFTFEISDKEVPFLDTIVYIDTDRTLKTKLYKKPTDRSFLLHNDSNHPNHSKEGIIYSQALRYNRIIHDDTLLEQELHNFTKILLARGYHLNTINKNILRALQYTQKDLLYAPRHEPDNNTLPFVTTYTKKGRLTTSKLKDIWQRPESDYELSTWLPTHPTMAYKNTSSIRNTLIRTVTNPPDI